jgi:hypothetical protein
VRAYAGRDVASGVVLSERCRRRFLWHACLLTFFPIFRVLILFLDHKMRDQFGQSRAATRARNVRAIETLQQFVRQAMEVFDRKPNQDSAERPLAEFPAMASTAD